MTTTSLGMRVLSVSTLAAAAALAIGCSPKSRATTAASVAWSCPEDRIELGAAPTVVAAEPPAEVASDPARLAIWRKNAGDASDKMNFSAAGCGHTGNVACFADTTGQSMIWRCVETTSTPKTSALKAKVEEVKTVAAGSPPDALEAIAKQLEQLGEVDEAQRVRARAQTLRTGSATNEPAPPPPAAPTP